MPQRILASLKSLVNKRKYLIELQFSLHKCPKPSWQGFRPPQNQANAHLILANSSLKKCPKPSGQGSRPTHPYGQCPNAPRVNLRGASLISNTNVHSGKYTFTNPAPEGRTDTLRLTHIPQLLVVYVQYK